MNLPSPTAEKILGLVDVAWKSFFHALADWKEHPEKYSSKPRIPRYKKKDGQFILPFTKSQISFEAHEIILPKITKVSMKTRMNLKNQIIGVRIVPKGMGYVLELIYVKCIPRITQKEPKNVVGIDIGVTNLTTMVNNIGKKPIVVKGGVIKSINQYYNKERARIQSTYDRQGVTSGKKLLKLTDKRNRKIHNFFHEVSHFIATWCLNHNIDTIILGRNKNWKHQVNLGKKTNQNFVSIPFYRLIGMIEYKAQDVGIRVIQVREDYTSKCSFLDNEPLSKRLKYAGKRVTRGLYKSKAGLFINSDVNGAYNIIKKEIPNAFTQWET
jgi:putative transposase